MSIICSELSLRKKNLEFDERNIENSNQHTTIYTKSLALRPINDANVQILANIMAKPEVKRWAKGLSWKTREQIQAALKIYYKFEAPNYAAALYKDQEMVGLFIIERDADDDFYYIDLYIDPPHQRKGYASEVLTDALVQHIKHRPEIKKIAFYIATQNSKSFNLYKKLKSLTNKFNIELKLIHGPGAALWNSPLIRKITYGLMMASVTGIFFYFNCFKNKGDHCALFQNNATNDLFKSSIG